MLSNVKLAQKVYDVQLIGKKVKFRPFTVREEKNILMSLQESSDQQFLQLKETLIACTFGKIDINELAVAEVEMLFVAIRNKSLGETMDIIVECDHCGSKNKQTLDLQKVRLIEKDKVNPEIKLADDLWVTMKFPTLNDSYKMMDKQTDDGVIEMLANCMVSVITNDEQIDCSQEKLSERVDFIENLSHGQLELINTFIQSAPSIKFEDTYVCEKCGKSNDISVEGLQNFFV